MKITPTLVIALAGLLAAGSPASSSQVPVKCASGLTPAHPVPVHPVPTRPVPASPTVSPSMVPALNPPLDSSPVQAAPAPVDSDSPPLVRFAIEAAPVDFDSDDDDGVPIESDRDAGDASEEEDDDSAGDDASAPTPAPAAVPISNVEVGADFDTSGSAQQPSAPAAPATQTPTETSATNQDGVDPATCLDAHNSARAEVGVALLTWDTALAVKGAAWAQHMSDLNFFDHSTPGQSDKQMNNLYGGTDCIAAVDAFRSEKSLLPVDRIMREDGYKAYAHYSMMVWHSTTRVGCGRGVDKNLVCYYETPGNTIGEAAY